jgi:hypothetical protein
MKTVKDLTECLSDRFNAEKGFYISKNFNKINKVFNSYKYEDDDDMEKLKEYLLDRFDAEKGCTISFNLNI